MKATMKTVPVTPMDILLNKITGVLLPGALLAAAPIFLPGRILIIAGVIFGAALTSVAWPLGFGALSGAVGAAAVHPEKHSAAQVGKIFVGALLGIGLAAPLSKYFDVDAWEYLLGLSTLCGLVGRIIARAVYRVFERRTEPALEAQADKYLGKPDKPDKPDK